MVDEDIHNFIHICETVQEDPDQTKTTVVKNPIKKRSVSVASPIKPLQPPVIQEKTNHTSVSRRKQHQATLHALQDAPQRANYMATYHAKPYELDRRSDAVHPTIPQSHDSQHLFQNTSSTSNQPKTCPFEACHIHTRIIRAITSNPKCNLLLSRPTIIQQNTWNQIMHRYPFSTKDGSNTKCNYFIQSETGSGKTLAYLIPILQSIAQRSSSNIPPSTIAPTDISQNLQENEYDRQHLTAIIVCPTRELTVQTGDLVHILCLHSFSWMVSGTLSGGEKRKTEKALLRRGVHILVSTPGRLLDHLHKTSNLLQSLQKYPLQWLVFDETDRLLMDGMNQVDLKNVDAELMTGSGGGLQKQVQEIIQIIRHQGTHSWQSILVSATISERLQILAKKILSSSQSDQWIYCNAATTKFHVESIPIHDKAEIVGNTSSDKLSTYDNEQNIGQLTESTPQQLTQLFMVVSMKLRLPALVAFLATRIAHGERMVVFMSTCDEVDFYSNLLQNFPCIIKDTRKHSEPVTDIDEANKDQGIFGNLCAIYRLHGNVPHHERQKIVKQFSDIVSPSLSIRRKDPAILFATDVAARGLNFPSIDWIIQYDPPCETSDYIHRAGRAARAGKAGHALLFVLPTEQQYIDILKKRGLIDMTALSLSSTFESASKMCPKLTLEGVLRSGGNTSRKGESFATALQAKLEDWIIDDDRVHKEAIMNLATKNSQLLDKRSQKRKEKRQAQNSVGPFLEKARKAYFAYIQSYPTREKALKHIFSPRALHLGHVARSFALKEVPSSIPKAFQTKVRKGGPEKFLDDNGKKRSARLSFEMKDEPSAKKRKNE